MNQTMNYRIKHESQIIALCVSQWYESQYMNLEPKSAHTQYGVSLMFYVSFDTLYMVSPLDTYLIKNDK